jgi:short-subunit dehydrogenase
LLADGWQVLSVDRQLHASTGNLEHLPCDLSDAGKVDVLIDALAEFAPFDLVILNAGASATGKFETLPFNVQEKLVRLNTETPMVLASALAARNMMANPSSLVFVSSLSHFTAYPGASTYAATKSALAIYAKSLRKPFAKLGITVSCVFPGPIATTHADRHAPKDADPKKRMPPEIAAANILAAIRSGRRVTIPGMQNLIFAGIGKLVPGPMARIMRQIIYKKLQRDVW